MIITCLNCGKSHHMFELHRDKLGLHAVCMKCGSSFDVDDDIMSASRTFEVALEGGIKKMRCTYGIRIPFRNIVADIQRIIDEYNLLNCPPMKKLSWENVSEI